MTACAAGISTGEVRRSSGGASRLIRKPNPIVTALAPNGSISGGSATPLARPPIRCSPTAAAPPTSSAVVAAAAPNTMELVTASSGGTKATLPRPTVPNAR